MRKVTLIVGLVVALGAVGCGADASREDARDTRTVDKTPPEVIAYNNKFPNVEHKCDRHGHRVYVVTETSVRPVVVPDPSCPGYVSQGDPVGDE